MRTTTRTLTTTTTFFLQSKAKRKMLSEAKQTPAEQLALLSRASGMQSSQRLKINQTSLKNEKLFWFVPLKFQISKKCKKCAKFQKNVFTCACFITLIAILILILKWLFGFQWSGRPENLNCLHICKIWWINATTKMRACVKIIYLCRRPIYFLPLK